MRESSPTTPSHNLRKAQGVLRRADKCGPRRLDETCGYLLHFGATERRRLTHVLENGVPFYGRSTQELRPASLTEQALGFLHPPESFAAKEVAR